MTTDLPDEHDPLESARREAAARAQGAKNRYLITTGDVIDVTSRQRKRLNFRKSRTVRLTMAGTALALVAATAIVANRDVIAQGVIELARTMAPAEKPQVQEAVAATSPAPAVPLLTSDNAAVADPALDLQALAPATEPDPTLALEPADDAQVAASDPGDAQQTAQAQAQAEPAPAPAQGPVSRPSQVKPVVLMPLPIEEAKPTRVVPPPKLAVAPAPKASALPGTLGADTPAARPPQESAVSPELVAAVNNARSKVEPATVAKQPAKSANGVFAQLPEKKPAKAPAASAAPAPTETAAPAPRPFSVVSHFTGGLLVRVGQQVNHVRIGESLPNGKRLVSVNENTGAYMAE